MPVTTNCAGISPEMMEHGPDCLNSEISRPCQVRLAFVRPRSRLSMEVARARAHTHDARRSNCLARAPRRAQPVKHPFEGDGMVTASSELDAPFAFTCTNGL